MIYEYLSGELVEVDPAHAVIDVGGIGYRVAIPVSLLGKMPLRGAHIKLFVSFVIRENAQALYGFLTSRERNLFELLINLSGVGPKTALNILGHVDEEGLQEAVRSENVIMLTKIPGIGIFNRRPSPLPFTLIHASTGVVSSIAAAHTLTCILSLTIMLNHLLRHFFMLSIQIRKFLLRFWRKLIVKTLSIYSMWLICH